jgi:Domain of unknown function (DUF4326)
VPKIPRPTLFPLDDARQHRLLAGEAVVVHVGKGRDPLADWARRRGLLVYIGRGTRGGCRESPFHNPFRLQDHGRDEAIRLYRANLERRPDLLVQLPRLRGRALGCWYWPQPCHGDVLCALLAA